LEAVNVLSTREFSIQAVSCMRSKRIVRHSKFAPAMTAWGQNLRLPHRNTDGRFSLVSGHKAVTWRL
jgi:hypothetical protein